MRMKNFAAALAALCLAASLSACGPEKITGNEWIAGQGEHLGALEGLAEEMDEVYSLYVIGAMDPSDMENEIKLLKLKYAACIRDYGTYNEEHPIAAGGHSWFSKKGWAALEGVHQEIKLLLDSTLDGDGTPLPTDQILYLYVSYRAELSDGLADFRAARDLIAASELPEEFPDHQQQESGPKMESGGKAS